jgi:hypothetical protein
MSWLLTVMVPPHVAWVTEREQACQAPVTVAVVAMAARNWSQNVEARPVYRMSHLDKCYFREGNGVVTCVVHAASSVAASIMPLTSTW